MRWKLVPVEPTHEMTGAILKPTEDRGDLLAIWELMLAGAPSAADDSELVERVARAMCVADDFNPDFRGQGGVARPMWQNFKKMAVAAFKTLEGK